MDPATLSALAGFPERLEGFFQAVPQGFTGWAPASYDGIPSERFTAIEQVCHVRDIEVDGYHLRFRRLLQEDRPTLASLDSYALAKERRYSEARPEDVFAIFRRARKATITLLEGLTPDQLLRQGTFEGYGPVSVKSLVHFLCSHDQQHLAGLQWLLGKIRALPTAGQGSATCGNSSG